MTEIPLIFLTMNHLGDAFFYQSLNGSTKYFLIISHEFRGSKPRARCD